MRLDRRASFAREERTLNTPQDKHVYGISLWRRAAVWPLAAVMRLWAMTIRVKIVAGDAGVVRHTGEPTIFILWHNRLFMAAEYVRRYRTGQPIYGLVSASRDGAWLAAYYSVVGLRAVRGSSSRLGREAAATLVDVLRAGNDIGITPDGPRGPMYDIKPGAVIVARRARARVVIVGMDFESAWRLPSWDGFYIPKPFSRIYMRFEVFGVDRLLDRDEGLRAIAGHLVEMNPDRMPAPVRKRA
jgi:lysophospholipid acyltransferase (LPLAT)-like uncharacterized protein